MEKNFFDLPIAKTKVTSANIQGKEAILGYFIGPFIAFISNAIFGSYLNRYYTDVLGLTKWAPRLATLMPVISVIFVIIGNVVVGRLIDKTRTSQGKARPYLLISAPLVAIAILLLFMSPNNQSTSQMIWIVLSYNIYYAVAYPFFYTSHSSMVALSTRNSNHRGILATLSNASGVMAVGIGASIVFPLFQGLLFVTRDGGVDSIASYNAWRIFMIILSLTAFLGIILEYYYTRERITEETANLNIDESTASFKQQLGSVVTNKYWWLIMLYFFLFQFGGITKNSSMTYYSRWMFDATNESSAGNYQALLGVIGGVPTAIGMFLSWPIANKLGKQKSVVYGLCISVIGGLVSFIDVHNFMLVCTGVVLKGIGAIPAMYVTLALLSDVLDNLEAKNGFRSDGLTMSIYGAVMVGMSGLGNGIINLFLSSGGYDSSLAVQSSSVQTALVICYLGIEIVCYAIIAVMLLFLDVEKHTKSDHQTILEHQKKTVLASGGEWIEPSERLRIDQEKAEHEAEIIRVKELKAYCQKRNLDFETEETKYQDKKQKKKVWSIF